jgi:Squalene/phytoene synthase
MKPTLASEITRAASKQTYYTIRFLVDRARMDDAYRAYAYFRWVDDTLDADGHSGPQLSDAERLERTRFLDRQRCLLEQCLRGAWPADANAHERMLVDLTQHAGEESMSVQAYLRNMMRVMEFDVARRGRLISQAELNGYTRWLAIAVTEAVHHFVGNDVFAPRDETRYMAASAAHIMHMLRDTYDDVRSGYYNVPREVLEAHGIGPIDVDSDAYRAWVQSRVQTAQAYFDGGKAHLARVQNLRYRLAGLTYMARFEWLTKTLEKEDFRLRAEYSERHSLKTGVRMGSVALLSMFNLHAAGAASQPLASEVQSKL